MTVKASKHKCLSCKKPVTPDFAVETDDGFIHQVCFRKGI